MVARADLDVVGWEGYVVSRSGATFSSSGKLAAIPAKNAATPIVGCDSSRRMYSDAPKIPPLL